jgi:hypothetical protein
MSEEVADGGTERSPLLGIPDLNRHQQGVESTSCTALGLLHVPKAGKFKLIQES